MDQPLIPEEMRPVALQPPAGRSDPTMRWLRAYLDASYLPANLKERLWQDSHGGESYWRLSSLEDIRTKPGTSNYLCNLFGCLGCQTTTLVNDGNVAMMTKYGQYYFLGSGFHSYFCCGTQLGYEVSLTTTNQVICNGPLGFINISDGNIGVMSIGSEYKLLAPGAYEWNCATVSGVEVVSILGNSVARLGPYTLLCVADGFVAVTFHHGVLTILGHQEEEEEGDARHHPRAPTFRAGTMGTAQGTVISNNNNNSINGDDDDSGKVSPRINPISKFINDTQTGTFTLGGVDSADAIPAAAAAARGAPGQRHTAPSTLREASRMYFLDDPNWVFKGFLSLQMNTDRLEGNDLMSKDNVEIIMVAMSQWRIVNPHLAITHCAPDMEGIASDVNQLVRATIARIVANTNIGAGPVAAGVTQPTVMALALSPDGAPLPPPPKKDDDDADLAHMMQSHLATQFMAELQRTMDTLGVEVLGVYVPEKRIKNDDTRQQVASQAIIGIRAQAQRAAAEASAYATVKAADAEAQAARVRADATAYTTVTVAKADAEAIKEVAAAHAAAGSQLGKPTDTAARLALTDRTAKALEGAKVTIFSGGPSNMAYMLNGDSSAGEPSSSPSNGRPSSRSRVDDAEI